MVTLFWLRVARHRLRSSRVLVVEYAFTHNWSAKIEYLHVFSKGNFVYDTVGACGIPGCFLRTKDVDMVRVGLNYRFGGPSGGVVAKY